MSSWNCSTEWEWECWNEDSWCQRPSPIPKGALCRVCQIEAGDDHLSPRMQLRVEKQQCHSWKKRTFSRVLVKCRFLRDYWELEAEISCVLRSRSVAFISGFFITSLPTRQSRATAARNVRTMGDEKVSGDGRPSDKLWVGILIKYCFLRDSWC